MPSYASQSAEESKLVASAPTHKPGSLRKVYAINLTAADRYVFVFDGLDESGPVVLGPFLLHQGDAFAEFFDEDEFPFTVGIFVASSTSGTYFTRSRTNDIRINSRTT